MSETNLTAQTSENTTAQETAQRVKFYATREEAEPNRPESAKSDAWKVYCVTRPDGTTTYLWAFTGIQAVNDVARADGYTAGAVPRAKVTESDVVAALKQFTPEQLAKYGLTIRTVDAAAAQDEQPAPTAPPAKSNRQKKREAKAAANLAQAGD